MTWFSTNSIKRKLTFVMMAACSISLLLACAAILFFEVAGFKQTLLRNAQVMAEVIGANAAAALSFENRDAARESLLALKGEPNVISAAIYGRDGEIFATYTQEGKTASFPVHPAGGEVHRFGGEALDLFHPLLIESELVGTLYVQADLRVVRERFITYAWIIGVVMVSVSCIALALSLRLQRLISGPISQLADVANRVAREENYSIRAESTSRDEMGQLIERFNEMLAAIQERDRALMAAQHELEDRVDARTKELQLEIRERSKVEIQLRLSQQKFETLVNSIEAVVWEAEAESLQFTFVSQQAEKLLGFPRAHWVNDAEFWRKHILDKDLAGAERSRGNNPEKPNQLEYRMMASDGRAVWVREISACLLEPGQAPILRGVFFDITEEKEAQKELDSLNRRLLESSRQAGMAEIATGVLHNVGNVLNSVNVSATLIRDQVRNSRANNLKAVVGLLNENAADLGTFITTHPKGKVIPTYLNSLADRLQAENSKVMVELDSLAKNIEHIKEIVAMQQTYARVSGLIEILPARNLVEDALQMNAAALTRHGIELVRDFDEAPPTPMDKHKVLQILVNLIRNAKYALDDSPEPNNKRLTVSIRRGEGSVQIIVADNGVGIPPENLTRIFSHGFTTKKDGHGFGLHSGALAARQMGGSLRAHSDGPGQGATFTLELPLQSPKCPAETEKQRQAV